MISHEYNLTTNFCPLKFNYICRNIKGIKGIILTNKKMTHRTHLEVLQIAISYD